MIPAVSASHHVGPPDETGMGAGDVSNEPNHAEDANGLDCKSGCVPSEVGNPLSGKGKLIMDGDYSTGYYPYFVDVNAVLRNTIAEAPGVEYQDHLYPGVSFLAAWFGWWADKGRGEVLRDDNANPAGSIPGVADGEADGSINDGHDDHATHGNTRHTGPWDELVWRGDNPWASQHDHKSHPNDVVYAFVHPGTHSSGPTTAPIGNTLSNGDDNPSDPDYTMDDRTAQVAQSPGPLSHNNQGYGWINGAGWYGTFSDQSLLMTTKITYAANPEPMGGGLFDRLDANASDVDVYTAVHPALEDAYRTAVWDPGHVDEEESDDNMDLVHENGTKERAQVEYAETIIPAVNTVFDAVGQLTEPVGPAQGTVNDATGDKPRPHEPETGLESFAGGSPATAGDDTYGGIGEEYYTPGANRDYSGYKTDYKPWTDFQASVASAQFLIQVRGYGSFNLYAANPDNAERTQGPSALWIGTNVGAWWDATDDDWIGNLNEEGRTSSPDQPYASGQVEDPNDYGDTPGAHRDSSQEENWTAEWKPARSGVVSATIKPVCDPAEENAEGECPWGSTSPPAGVYILQDNDGNQFNPYDDAAEDAIGMPCGTPTVAQLNCDEDGQRLSRYVQYGPIKLDFLNSGGGNGFLMEENVVFPTGTLDYKVKIDGNAKITSKLTDRDGVNLQGQSVSDVDFLVPATGN